MRSQRSFSRPLIHAPCRSEFRLSCSSYSVKPAGKFSALPEPVSGGSRVGTRPTTARLGTPAHFMCAHKKDEDDFRIEFRGLLEMDSEMIAYALTEPVDQEPDFIQWGEKIRLVKQYLTRTIPQVEGCSIVVPRVLLIEAPGNGRYQTAMGGTR